jgi:hypothetical protein
MRHTISFPSMFRRHDRRPAPFPGAGRGAYGRIPIFSGMGAAVLVVFLGVMAFVPGKKEKRRSLR